MYALELTRTDNPKLSQYIDSLLNDGRKIIEKDMSNRIECAKKSKRTKMKTYCVINPNFDIHPIYTNKNAVDDYLRVTFTRLRTSSHRLRIETGRWSRLAPEKRVCRCGEVQTECHALTECPLVEDIRERYGCQRIDFHSFMCDDKATYELLMLYEILGVLES